MPVGVLHGMEVAWSLAVVEYYFLIKSFKF
jgi:hypothetical protein